MNTVAAELETLLQILLITHRLTEAEVEAIRRAKRNPVLLAVVEQFRVDHDLTEAADTLRLTCESGLVDKVDEACDYNQLVDEEEELLSLLHQYIPMRSTPIGVNELESILLKPVSAEAALYSAVSSTFFSPKVSWSFQADNTISLPFDSDINQDIFTTLHRAFSSYELPGSSILSDKATEAHFTQFPFGKPALPIRDSTKDSNPKKEVRVVAKDAPNPTTTKVPARRKKEAAIKKAAAPVKKSTKAAPKKGKTSLRSSVKSVGKQPPITCSAGYEYLAPTLIRLAKGAGNRSKVAGFDMDSTLIRTKTGAKFPTSRDDWQWLHPQVPEKLREYHESGYKIVIFTNQAGIANGKQNLLDIVGKIQDMSVECGVPIEAYIATSKDMYRKPNPRMWFEMGWKSSVPIDKAESLFVGDAAGRPAKGLKKKDFSCDDRKFAANLGLTFYTEAEFFLGAAKEEFSWMGVEPKKVTATPSAVQAFKQRFGSYARTTQEMVLNIGPPASGKSTFTKKYLLPAGYVWINQDVLKTFSNAAALEQGKPVVIDNTNASKEKRSHWVSLAKQYNIPVRVLIFNTDFDLAHHLNKYRERMTLGSVKAVPEIAYNMFKSHYAAPTLDEGIEEITHVPFIPDLNGEERSIFEQFF